MNLSITLIGRPTVLIEIDGFRLLTDPTFDAPGSYQLPHVTLEKLEGPAMSAEAVGEMLLSHDQHSDNLDHSGKEFLAQRADHGGPRQTAWRPRRRISTLDQH
jgi:L-ascorbate metabolism protein UlaG (beta-lactamase superfamily)